MEPLEADMVSVFTMRLCALQTRKKVWVYRSKGTKFLRDTFDIEEPTAEEFVKVMLESLGSPRP
jgi:hypothetical protein